MASLVFKVKFEETLRRWVVPAETVDAQAFSLTLQQLETKIRDLFGLPPTAPLTITYVDKDNDMVTLGDDQDLIDACLVQQLNPLRLEVRVRDEKPSFQRNAAVGQEQQQKQQEEGNNTASPVTLESLLKFLDPDVARDSVRNALRTFAPFVDPNLADQAMNKVDEAMKDVLNKVRVDQCPYMKERAGTSQWPYMKEKAGTSHPKENLKEQTTKKQDDSDQSIDASEKGAPRDYSKGYNQEQAHKEGSEDPAIHFGVQCDRCGMVPIIGPRYNSKKVIDYDLCSGCFETDANQQDYHKLERPAYFPHHGHPHHGHPERPHFCPYPSNFKPSCRRPRSFMGPPACRPPFARGPYGWRQDVPNASTFSGASEEHKKLDARFVKDVTIFDGTELAPHTKFTKIWRVSNNGTITWPQGIQLLHIGGDSLCVEDAVTVQVPEGGLACGEDLEASVDLIAPEKAGRYVSHWRLASPSGQKFGHRLWVMIQVVPQGEQSPQLEESLKDNPDDVSKEVLNLEDTSKIHGATTGVTVSGLPDLLDFKEDDRRPTGENTSAPVETLGGKESAPSVGVTEDASESMDVDKEPAASVDVIEDASKSVDIIDDTATLKMKTSPEIVTSGEQAFEVFDVKSEVDGFSVISKPSERAEWFDISMNDAVENEGQKQRRIETDNVDIIQEMHLQSLESMGFVNRNLNVLLLKKNNQNMQTTVDDLLVASGWDGALKDLEDMGFTDQARNIQLLMKNNGSIKLVVKELVKMEKLGNK